MREPKMCTRNVRVKHRLLYSTVLEVLICLAFGIAGKVYPSLLSLVVKVVQREGLVAP